MTGSQTLPPAARDDIRLLVEDLACVSGALSEIATTWRRAWPQMAELPLALPLRLQDTVRQFEEGARSLAGPGPGQAALLSGQLSALSEDTVAARALTCGPGSAGVGDALLWESLSAALGRAAARLPVTTAW
jgi:hypothetical protein